MNNQVQILLEQPNDPNALGFNYKRWEEIRDFGKIDNNYNNILKNKKVVIVGPSPSLEDKNLGNWIDSFDIVIRLNTAFPIKEEKYNDLGKKTDIQYHSLCTDEFNGGLVRFKELKENNVFLSCPYPKLIQPFTLDFVKFFEENKKWEVPYHEIGLMYYQEIVKMIGTRPNTGTLAILDILAHDIKELHIIGFTWFRDGWQKSYKDPKKILGNNYSEDVEKKLTKANLEGRHKQKPQEDLVREIYLNDNRVFIDDVMKQILNVN